MVLAFYFVSRYMYACTLVYICNFRNTMGKLSPLEREVQERVLNMCPHDSRYTEERLLKYSLTGILSR